MDSVQGIYMVLTAVAAIAPVATFGVVLVAYLSYRQKLRADRRDQWWKRAQWAIDSALYDADPQRRLAGLKVMVELIGSDLATTADAELMSDLAVGIQDQELEYDGGLRPGVRPGHRPGERGGGTAVELPSRGETVTAASAASARILEETERVISAATGLQAMN
ncbi:hypothetical protein V1639_13405 [Pseudarthrobacter sp. J75]|uniref:hypothetical protein n=1 Tax=unclassified Pseudarthrobacter TaxID=2647000 RepID=UPI002E7FD6A8|nr:MULTISPECIES: hypothetical protein [unclassified Pseudarthrobacter]MEE2523626.1 hypothetical protein [Pseudarthrobacter sp. J47]MEE2530016.1 hypothetical protein [Pseudarthrobacter sp. J75]MEE2570574.1 hypothetical protein [Pseudarthrobacter sp. J64]